MKQFWGFCVAVLISASLFTSCNQASLIGADIIPTEDNINVAYTDTLSLRATTVREDSVKVYDPSPSLQPSRHLLGHVNDPEFGIYTSNIYTQLELLTTSPEFEGATLDSIVLVLAYSPKGHYGDLSKPFNLKVFEVTEDMEETSIYYSDQEFATASALLGEKTFIPAPLDSVLIDTNYVQPHIRIPLDNALGERFLNVTDSTVYQSDAFFTDYFKGLKIVGNDGNNDAIIAFNLLSAWSNVEIHYTIQDTIQKVFGLRAKSGSTKTMNFTHDYSAAPVLSFIDNTTLGDSLVFVQSLEGLNVKIEMPYIDEINNILVNKADLVVQVAQDANSTIYPIPEQLILLRKNSNGEFIFIEDIAVSISRTSSFQGSFGGQSEENAASIMEYSMNISSHLQDMIDGSLDNSDLYLTTYPKSGEPNRLIIGGTKHSQYKMKIQLTYTKLD